MDGDELQSDARCKRPSVDKGWGIFIFSVAWVASTVSACTDSLDEVFKDVVHVFDNPAMGDKAHQYVLSIIGNLISAKRELIGSGALGQITDSEIGQLLPGRAHQQSDIR